MSHRDAIHKEEYKGLNIYIVPDDDPQACDPMDWDILGKQVYWHRRMNLGHCWKETNQHSPEEWFHSQVKDNCWKWVEQSDEYIAWADEQERTGYDADVDTYIENEMDLEKLWEAFDKYHISIPVHAYEHGGITISASGRRAGWDSFDSGQLGFVYVSNSDVYKEFKVTAITQEIREKVEDILRGEVEEYDSYLTGQVYGFIIEDENGEQLDSCWGFVGDYKYCLEDARRSADYYVEQKEKELQLYDERMSK